ncbi:hypothetical protein LI328DRAFT_133021, partial [Trichoderma asperelloides]
MLELPCESCPKPSRILKPGDGGQDWPCRGEAVLVHSLAGSHTHTRTHTHTHSRIPSHKVTVAGAQKYWIVE